MRVDRAICMYICPFCMSASSLARRAARSGNTYMYVIERIVAGESRRPIGHDMYLYVYI